MPYLGNGYPTNSLDMAWMPMLPPYTITTTWPHEYQLGPSVVWFCQIYVSSSFAIALITVMSIVTDLGKVPWVNSHLMRFEIVILFKNTSPLKSRVIKYKTYKYSKKYNR